MQPDFKVFPLSGWDRLPKSPGLRRPGQHCPSISFINDFNDKRGEFIHGANDLFTNLGTPCVAVTDGVAWPNVKLGDKPDEFAYWKDGGWHFYIKGDDGHYYYYAHLRDKPIVRPGERVQAGQLIGYAGRSGNMEKSTACTHLHLALYGPRADGSKGPAINPYPYLVATKPFALSTPMKIGLGVGAGIIGISLASIGGYLLYKAITKQRRSSRPTIRLKR